MQTWKRGDGSGVMEAVVSERRERRRMTCAWSGRDEAWMRMECCRGTWGTSYVQSIQHVSMSAVKCRLDQTWTNKLCHKCLKNEK